MDMRFEPGHCWISGKPCFDIISKYANDHKLAGHVLRVGNPHPEAHRVTLLLMNGKNASITVHEDCLGEVQGKLNELWHTICAGAIQAYIDAPLADHTLNKEKADEAHKNTVKEFANNPPLCVVSVIKWRDLQ